MKERLSMKRLDKNGKEIFVDDIVRFYFDEHLGYEEHGTEMIDLVIFEKGIFYFVLSYGNGHYIGGFAHLHYKECEVIGNVHDNASEWPELTKFYEYRKAEQLAN